jgi:chemotaxis protein histidine kinase CheA
MGIGMILVWTGLAIAASALIVVLASAGRLRRFLKLREEVRTRLQDLATVVAPAQAETKAVLDEAKPIFHELGTRMSGFARVGISKLSLRGMGFDPSLASGGLIGFSNALPTYGIERLRWRAQVERALKIENGRADARMNRSRLDPLLFVLALAALAVAAWTYTANRNLRHALQSAHAVQASIEEDTRRTRDRAAQAEKATLAAEQSIAEVRAELATARNGQAASARSLAAIDAQLALTQKAKVAAEQSAEKMKEQLAASESARKAAEDRLKALGDELAALTTAKDDAERSLKAANDELARLKSEASDTAAAKAVENLERERKAREAAEQASPSPPGPTP